jgi:hypothetical protein
MKTLNDYTQSFVGSNLNNNLFDKEEYMELFEKKRNLFELQNLDNLTIEEIIEQIIIRYNFFEYIFVFEEYPDGFEDLFETIEKKIKIANDNIDLVYKYYDYILKNTNEDTEVIEMDNIHNDVFGDKMHNFLCSCLDIFNNSIGCEISHLIKTPSNEFRKIWEDNYKKRLEEMTEIGTYLMNNYDNIKINQIKRFKLSIFFYCIITEEKLTHLETVFNIFFKEPELRQSYYNILCFLSQKKLPFNDVFDYQLEKIKTFMENNFQLN